MSGAGSHIVLLIPGLAGPASDHPIGDYFERRPAALDRLLSPAQSAAAGGHDPDSTALHAFGLDTAAAVAPLTWTVDSGAPDGGFVMRADPVHLRADQSSLRLFESHSFPIEREEADALVAAFNDFYRDTGWRLQAPVPQRWYLRADAPHAIDTLSPWAIAGEDINQALPRGAAAREWHTWLNEIQMLFHVHDVNLAREQRGLPVINSIWPWGGGVMPAAGEVDLARVQAQDPLVLALAQLSGITAESSGEVLPDDVHEGCLLFHVDTLCWPARYNEVERWLEQLFALEDQLFGPLHDALARKRIASLAVLPCNGRRYTVTRRQLRGFWRRTQPYETVLA